MSIPRYSRMLEPAIAKMMRRIDAYVTVRFAVCIRSFLVHLLVIAEKSANVDDGFTIMSRGMNTERNTSII